MSDMADDFRMLGDINKARRTLFGIPCPLCVKHLPLANPKILTPGDYCRMHGYTDPRPELTDDQNDEVARRAGVRFVRTKATP